MSFVYSVIDNVFSFLSIPIISGVSIFGVLLAAVLFVLLVRYF